MIILLKREVSESEVGAVAEEAVALGYQCRISRGKERVTIVAVGNGAQILPPESLRALGPVESIIPMVKPYELTSREGHPEPTVVDVAGVPVGGDSLVVMAGPCCVESEQNIVETAEGVKRLGADVLRGGAFKPRTSPYSFQGLGGEGLRCLARARELTGLPVVTELLSISNIKEVISCADLVQIGARNAQNTPLLCEIATSGKPVLLKRGMACTIQEWLMAAEYMLSNGNPNVILCERGIRSFETMTRNTLDLSAVAAAKRETHLPVIVDPSHGTGDRRLVIPMARAAIAAGADGLMVEVHTDPDHALSDGAQSLNIEMFGALMKEIGPIAEAMGRTIGSERRSCRGRVHAEV